MQKLLVLDLDETLIYATEIPLHKEQDFVLYPYLFYKRPGVEKFIRQMSDIFYIGIWTASTHDYARIVVQNIIPNDVNIRFVWSRERCTMRFDPDTYEHNYMKNLDKLKKLGYNLKSVIMVDDTPKKLARHYGNLVHVIPQDFRSS